MGQFRRFDFSSRSKRWRDLAAFNRGLETRREVLGADDVDKSIATADDFSGPMQQLTRTRSGTGPDWERKTRSLLNLAMLSALNRPRISTTANILSINFSNKTTSACDVAGNNATAITSR